MRLLLIVALVMSPECVAQEPMTQAQQAAPTAQTPPPAEAPQNAAITIPAGTHVPLTLTSPMRARAARKGDSVRAVTAFPVTVGKQVAIPAGTYVEGVIDKLIRRGPSGRAGLQMHFTRIVFVNGYNAELDGANAEARRGEGETNQEAVSASGRADMTGMAMGFQQQPPALMPPPRTGPSPAVLGGIGFGIAAAVTVTAVLLGRGRAGDIVFDAGYPFEMVFNNSVSLDAERVADAVASSNAP